MHDRARAGCTVILTTHILDVAERLVDRIGIIRSGRLLTEGTLDELRLKPAGCSRLPPPRQSFSRSSRRLPDGSISMPRKRECGRSETSILQSMRPTTLYLELRTTCRTRRACGWKRCVGFSMLLKSMMNELARAAPDDLELQHSRSGMLNQFVFTYIRAGDLSRTRGRLSVLEFLINVAASGDLYRFLSAIPYDTRVQSLPSPWKKFSEPLNPFVAMAQLNITFDRSIPIAEIKVERWWDEFPELVLSLGFVGSDNFMDYRSGDINITCQISAATLAALGFTIMHKQLPTQKSLASSPGGFLSRE